jgi:peptidoglycan/LPS O-acetylase OafA/YrhL
MCDGTRFSCQSRMSKCKITLAQEPIESPCEPLLPITDPVHTEQASESRDKSKPIKKPKKLEYFDGLRGFAAWQVFNQHALTYTWLHPILGVTYSVHLFFVLSGRLICLSILNKKDAKTFVSCMIRRPFRLLIPVFFVYLFLYFFAKLNIFEPIGRAGVKASMNDPHRLWDLDYAQMHNITFVDLVKNTCAVFLFGKHKMLLPLWTISIELKYSFFLYGLALIGSIIGKTK